MNIVLEIPSIFRRYTENKTAFEFTGETIGEALEAFASAYPDVRKVFFDRDGKLLHSFDIYVNGESVYPLSMERALNDGDKLNIVMIINGG